MDFFKLIIRFVPQYKWRLLSYILLNVLCSVCGVFSFMAIIPLLQILFGLTQDTLAYTDLSTISSYSDLLIALKDNLLYYLQDKITIDGKIHVLCVVGGFVVLMSFLFNSISFFAYWVRIPIRTGISRDLRQDAYHKIVNMPIAGFANENRGDFVSRMTNDIEEVDYGLGTTLDMFIKDPIQIIVYVIAMIGLSPLLTCYSFIMLCVLCILILLLGKVMEKISLKAQANRGGILSAYEQTLGLLPIIKSYNSEESLSAKFWKLNKKSQDVFNKQNRFYSLAWPCTNFSIAVIVVLILCVGGRLILLNDYVLDAASFVGFLCVLYSLTTPVDDMMKCTFGIRKAMASLKRLNRILNIPDEYGGTKNKLDMTKPDRPIIEFKNVSFAYNSKPILKNVSFSISKGDKVAIMGNTGSGKTTMANIMSTLLKQDSGDFLINGIPLTDYSLSSVRDKIAYVSQDTVLFQDSILFNITLGDSNISFETVIEAAKRAHIHDYIMSLPEQYNTIVGDRGTTLSGGQRQCVALARAFVKDPHIYILDEATSAMDAQLESYVMEEISDVAKDKTVIIVTHNSRLTRDCNLIIVLDKGELIESGSPMELLEKKRAYSTMVSLHDISLLSRKSG